MRKTVWAFLMVLIGLLPSQQGLCEWESYGVFRNQLWRYGSPYNVQITTNTVTKLEGFTFDVTSPPKALMYLEKTPLADENLKPYFASRERPRYPYNPEDVVLILHICDLQGIDLQTVPIERKYSDTYKNGKWLSDKIVLLSIHGHGHAPGGSYTLFVHLDKGKKLVVNRWEAWHGVSADGEHLLIDWGGRVLFDDVQILPFYDPDPFFCSEPPDSPKYAALKAWWEWRNKVMENENKPDVHMYSSVLYKKSVAWWDGGKKFALVDHPPAALLFHEKKKEFIPEILERSRSPELVIVDVEKIPTGNINQYAQFIPLQIDYTKLGKDVQSGELPWPVYDEKENAIKLQANCVGPTGRTRLQTMAAIPVP